MPSLPPFGVSAALRSGDSALQHEIAGELASALGRMGREVERALAALRESEAAPGSPERADLLKSAAGAVWCYFVQREVNGMRNHRGVIADYNIPRDVLARLGVR
jgi:hypothetical protein